MKSLLLGASLALALLALAAPGAQAQKYGSLGFGAAKPVGDEFKAQYGTGYTSRGQVGYSMTLADVHVQTGYTRFPVKDGVTAMDDLNVYHAGVGARVGFRFLWVGANAAYFFGDGEKGVGYFPELGVKVWRFEGVVDYRLDGDEKWGAARVGFRF